MKFPYPCRQVPSTIGQFGLIDPATPESAYTRVGLSKANKGVTYDLVFSDEFEVDGRSFYDGDDPYWTAVDLHYWATNNLEWYVPIPFCSRPCPRSPCL
jgi:beta-glucanase (GH16 family)